MCERETEWETHTHTHTHTLKGERKGSSQRETRDFREIVKMSQVEMSAARWRGVKPSKSRRFKP